MRLLIIEDNHDLLLELADFFTAEGYLVDTAEDGITGLHLAVVNEYDVLILDLGLSGLNGLELCRRLRQESGKWMPVLMLTARDTVQDRIKGFEHGGDDYLVKPFSLRELLLRIRALSRRRFGQHNSALISCYGLELNSDLRKVCRDGVPITLTVIEFEILELLMRSSPKVVTRGEIMHKIWQDNPPEGDVLKVHMHNLRNAIDKPFIQQLLHTVRGIGYKIQSGNGLPA